MANFLGLSAFYEHLSQNILPDKYTIGHFNVFKVEDLLLPKVKAVSHNRRNFYKVSLITGHSRIHYADHSIEAKGTMLLFTNPVVPFFWERVSDGHTGYIAVFTEDFFNGLGDLKEYPVFQSAAAGVLKLSTDEAKPFAQLFARMVKELQGDYNYKFDLIRNLLMEIVHRAQKMQPAEGMPLNETNAYTRITGLFCKLLERQFPIEMTSQCVRIKAPSDFARQLNIHVNHLNKALKETTGQTTSQLISARLLQEAKVLLKTTSWTVNEIAWSLGFEEPNHFSSFFKNLTNTTPSAFRFNSPD
jgi:AraC family transcriptional regulator, transcriptional activator of pobA